MGVIVQLDRHLKKKEEREWDELDRKMEAFDKAVSADANKHTIESIKRILAAMTSLNQAMANTPFGRQVAAIQKETEKDFKKKISGSF